MRVSKRFEVFRKDNSPSAVSASLMEQGIDVYDLHIAPTPIVFRETRKYGAGVVVNSFT